MTDRLKILAVSFLLASLAIPVAAREKRSHFRGSFEGQQMLRLTLIRDGDRIRGVYLYEAVGEPIRIEGTAQGNDVRLSQVAEGGQRTGVFQGTWKGRIFSGNWTQPDDPEAPPLAFSFNSNSSPDDGTSGSYELFTGRLTNTLHILLLPGQRVLFRLSAYWVPEGTDPSFANTGVLSGSMRLDDDKAVYEEGDCQVTFDFSGRNVRVEQSAPGPACGMGQNVSGSGTYRQTDSEPDLAGLEGF